MGFSQTFFRSAVSFVCVSLSNFDTSFLHSRSIAMVNIRRLPSLWPPDNDPVEEFDPFSNKYLGNNVTERLRYLFLEVIVRKSPDEWRSPDGDNMKILALKSLYAAMIGFNKDHLSLLYPSGVMG